MNKHILEKFNGIYDATYKNTLKYVLLHCNDLDDVKDIVQDTYLDFYKYISRKHFIKIDNVEAYIVGIAKNVLKKYYRFKSKNSNIVSIYQNEDIKIISDSNIDIELQFITKENAEYVWNYIKEKDIRIAKIFYCFYYLDMKINEIAFEMQLNESTVKNYIYRTIKELQKQFKKEDYNNA